MSIGMQDFVTKPINPDEMFGALVKWIKPDTVIQEPKSQKPKAKSQKPGYRKSQIFQG